MNRKRNFRTGTKTHRKETEQQISGGHKRNMKIARREMDGMSSEESSNNYDFNLFQTILFIYQRLSTCYV